MKQTSLPFDHEDEQAEKGSDGSRLAGRAYGGRLVAAASHKGYVKKRIPRRSGRSTTSTRAARRVMRRVALWVFALVVSGATAYACLTKLAQ